MINLEDAGINMVVGFIGIHFSGKLSICDPVSDVFSNGLPF